MIIREWIVRTPTPHTVRLEWRLLRGELTVSVDGVVQISQPLWWSSEHGNEIRVDGVSHTLTHRHPQFLGRWVLLRTADITHFPQLTRVRNARLGRAIAALVLSILCFHAAYFVQPFLFQNVQPYLLQLGALVRQAIADPMSGPILMVVPVTLSALFFVASVYHLYMWWQEARLRPAKDETTSAGPAADAGAPPRTGTYFRPLLADIAATAARWKSRFFSRRFGRHRSSSS